MTSIRSKIFEVFRNLKPDATPRPPRSDTSQQQSEEVFDDYPQNNTENLDSTNEAEEIIIEPNEEYEVNEKGKKSKPKKPKDKSDKKGGSGFFKKANKDRRDSNSTVNTQATGPVINVVNSDNFHWGDDYTYYIGNKSNKNKHPKYDDDNDDEEEEIEKCNLITLLMEATEEPTQKYHDYISKNLGKKWKSFFRCIGFKKGFIETMEIDAVRSGGGVAEARYQLLLDWIRNEDNNSLGRLSTLLWEHGERQIVKDLALMYSTA